MKASNCLTRALHHWKKYGGVILYDNNHATVNMSKRVYVDNVYVIDKMLDLKEYGFTFILRTHNDFLEPEEIEILNKYFSS